MIKLKRSECAVLSLVLERKWFEMIERGEKREEYRDDSRYWFTRLENWALATRIHVAEFRMGYARNAPRMAFSMAGLPVAPLHLEPPFAALVFAKVRQHAVHRDWGEPVARHIVIALDERVELAD